MDNKPSTSSTFEQRHLDQLTSAWSSMIDCIAHDFVTPLSTLRLNGKVLAETFAPLLAGYRLAFEHKLVGVDTLSEKRLKMIEGNLLPDMIKTIDSLASFLSLLHPLNKELLSHSHNTHPMSVKTCIEEVLKKYPFPDEKDRALLQISCTNDFKFTCAPIFIEQLLANLLDNALYQIKQEGGKGKIKIWTEKEAHYNLLHVKDTASSMNDDMVEYLFSRFFAKRDGHVVPGLGFCKLALLQQGGDIMCDAVEKKHTDFVIKFPAIYTHST